MSTDYDISYINWPSQKINSTYTKLPQFLSILELLKLLRLTPFWLLNWVADNFKFADFTFLSFNSQLPKSRLKFSTNSSVSWKMIPFFSPELFDFYTLSQTKLLENHTLHSCTYLYSPYKAENPPGLLNALQWNKSNNERIAQPVG